MPEDEDYDRFHEHADTVAFVASEKVEKTILTLMEREP